MVLNISKKMFECVVLLPQITHSLVELLMAKHQPQIINQIRPVTEELCWQKINITSPSYPSVYVKLDLERCCPSLQDLQATTISTF